MTKLSRSLIHLNKLDSFYNGGYIFRVTDKKVDLSGVIMGCGTANKSKKKLGGAFRRRVINGIHGKSEDGRMCQNVRSTNINFASLLAEPVRMISFSHKTASFIRTSDIFLRILALLHLT